MDGAVRLRVAGKVFLPRGFLYDLAVLPEHFNLLAVVGLEVIAKASLPMAQRTRVFPPCPKKRTSSRSKSNFSA